MNQDKTKTLPGAVFTLSQGNQTIYTGTSNAAGEVEWKDGKNNPVKASDMEKGTYVLKETVAPDGYVITEEFWTMTVEAKGALPTLEDQNHQPVLWEKDEASNVYRLEIKNTAYHDLPSTGGSGIYGYIVGGIVFMIAAALILYKMRAREEF